MQPDLPFPLVEFLGELRARGFGINLHDYNDAGRLLSRWEGNDRGTFGKALAALLARNAEEVVEIRRAFEEWVSVEPPREEVPQTPKPPKIRPWHIALILLFIAAAAGAGTWRYLANKHDAKVKQVDQSPPSDTAYNPPPPTMTTREPDLGAEPREPARERPWILASILGSIALITFAFIEARRRQRRWTSKYWKNVLASMPGPHHYQHRLAGPPELFAKCDIEDVATILGRAREENPAVGESLDVDESLRLTLREGMRPHLVFEPPPRNQPTVVLQDVSWAMRPWQRKIDYFTSGLARQGVMVDRWYFDGDPLLVSRTPHDRLVPLDQLASTRASETSLMILSTGQGIPAESIEELARLLKKWMFRTWIHPIANPAYWQRETAALPIRIWPMTRAGVLAAAVEISRKSDSGESPLGAASPRNVTREDVARMKELIGLAPHPSLELAEDLRARFAPEVPEEVMLFLGAEGVFYGSAIRVPPAVESQDPQREAEVRRYLLEVLRESKPPENTVAELRWQLDEAMQRLELDPNDAQAAQTLRSLADGPLRAEVERAVGLMKAKPELGKPAPIPPTLPVKPAKKPPLFAWPRVRDVAVAAVVVTGASLLLGGRVGVEEGDPIPHRYGVYELVDAEEGSGYYVRARDKDLPPKVDVYRNDKRWIGAIDVSVLMTFVIVPENQDAWFDVRVQLPRGNWAASDSLWVPKSAVPPRPPTDWIDDALAVRLVETIQKVFGVAATPTTPFGGLSTDSEKFEEFYLELNNRFPDDEVPRGSYATVGEYAAAIRREIPNGPALVTLRFGQSTGPNYKGFRLVRADTGQEVLRGRGGIPVDVPPGRYGVTDRIETGLPFAYIDVGPYELTTMQIPQATAAREKAMFRGGGPKNSAIFAFSTRDGVMVDQVVLRRSRIQRLQVGEWVDLQGFRTGRGPLQVEKITPIPTPPGEAGLRTLFSWDGPNDESNTHVHNEWIRQHGGTWRETTEYVGNVVTEKEHDRQTFTWTETGRDTIDGTTGVVARRKGGPELVFIPDQKGGPKENLILIKRGKLWSVLVDLSKPNYP